MTKPSTTEIADRWSRRRAVVFVAGTLAFAGVQFITRPIFYADGSVSQGGHTTLWTWVTNAVVLMVCLATGGGLALGRKVRALMNDEISRAHYRKGTEAGFWVAMVAGLALFWADGSMDISGRQAAYILITSSLSVALLVFSYLEIRAHGDQ